MNEPLDSLVVAFATSDGFEIPRAHFGEARRYEIYRISSESTMWLDSVVNPKNGERDDQENHEHHANRNGRGSGIGRLLSLHGVQVMVSRAFGQNIVRMRQKFLPVKIDAEELDSAINLLQTEWDEVRMRWSQGAERKHLVLKSND
jgi:predicted Fe-Mo cluster-binding NifX family protein